MKVNVASRLFVEAMGAHLENINPAPTESSIVELLQKNEHKQVNQVGKTITEANDTESEVNKVIESFKEASLFGIVKWVVEIMVEIERQENGEEGKLGIELQSLLEGFAEYCTNKYAGAPITRIMESAQNEGVALPSQLIRDIESIIFLRYMNDNEVLKKYSEVKEIVDSLNSISISRELSKDADNIRVSSQDTDNVAEAIVSFNKNPTIFLRLGEAKGLYDLINNTIERTTGMVELLRAFTGWDEQYSRDRLSDLLRFYAKRIKKNWHGPLRWMIQNLYQEIRSTGIQKTKAACFIHNIFVPIVPDFTSWEVFRNRHPEVTYYDYRQVQLREVRKFARITD